MDRYTRLFILASLVYLSAGGILGLSMAIVPGVAAHVLFSHVHLLLGGFMAMMVFGVGYFILPRFAARTLQWPGLVAVHFWLANLSLLAMVVAYPIEGPGAAPVWTTLLHVGAAAQAVSFLMFSLNLGLTLLIPSKTAGAEHRAPVGAAAPERTQSGSLPTAGQAAGACAPAPAKSGSLPVVGQSAGAPSPAPVRAVLGPDTPIAEVVERKEGAVEVLVQSGLRPLADPAHLEMVKQRGLPVGYACRAHGIPVDELLARLEALPDRAAPASGAAGRTTFTAEQVIGAMVSAYPATREVLQRRFGEGCFTCPGFATETLAQGAMMHGVDVNDLLAELEEAVAARS
jgi:hybrid cluster-associated redox disulfide protein